MTFIGPVVDAEFSSAKKKLSDTFVALQESHPHIALGLSNVSVLIYTKANLQAMGTDSRSVSPKYSANQHIVGIFPDSPPEHTSHELFHSAMALCRARFDSTSLLKSPKSAMTLSQPFSNKAQKKELLYATQVGDDRVEKFSRLLMKKQDVLSGDEKTTLDRYKKAIDQGYYFTKHTYRVKPKEIANFKQRFPKKALIKKAIMKGKLQFHIGDKSLILYPVSVREVAGNLDIEGYLAPNIQEDHQRYKAFVKDHLYKKTIKSLEYELVAKGYSDFNKLPAKTQKKELAKSNTLEQDTYIMQNKVGFLSVFYTELLDYHSERCFKPFDNLNAASCQS